jgi:hypothetical protein
MGKREKGVQGFGGKSGRKESTRKNEAQMGESEQNGSEEDLLGGGGVWSGFTWLRIGNGGGIL